MIRRKDQRVGVFVDVQNMYYSAKNLFGHKVNFGEILKTAADDRKLIRAVAYVIRTQIVEEEQSFFDALRNQGFELRMKDLQVFAGGQKKGDWDVGMAIDAIRLSSKLDAVVLVTGDGDFIPAVNYLQNLGVQVEVIAFGRSTSAKLIEAADEFTDLGEDEKKYLLGGARRGIGGAITSPFRAAGRTFSRPRDPNPPANGDATLSNGSNSNNNHHS